MSPLEFYLLHYMAKKQKLSNQKNFFSGPSDAQYRKTKDIVVEAIVGDPSKLKNQTLYQDAFPEYDIESAYATDY